MRKIMSLILALCMLLTAGIFALAEDAPAEETVQEDVLPEISDTDRQILFLTESFDSFRQNEEQQWYYAVTDLDHNGCLELLAATKNGGNAKVWEVSKDGMHFEERAAGVQINEFFPDIVMENADTYHDMTADVWCYMFSRSFTGNELFRYTKCSVSLKNGAFSCDIYASETTEYINGYLAITYTDREGQIITPEEYNAAGVNALVGWERSSTNFGWFTAEDAEKSVTFVDSYAVFVGEKDPDEIKPAVQPEASAQEQVLPESAAVIPENQEKPEIVMIGEAPKTGDSAFGYPVYNSVEEAAAAAGISSGMSTQTVPSAPAQQYSAVSGSTGYLWVRKHPTNENRTVGSKATFVAIAENYTSLYWTFIDPYGREYTVQNFMEMFPSSYVGGANSLTLTVEPVTEGMAGWGVYCTFRSNNQTERTNTAYISIRKSAPVPAPNPTAKRATGHVTDYLMSSVTIRLENGNSIQVLKDKCTIAGTLQTGAPCDVYYSGDYPTSSNVTWVSIQGIAYPVYPQPAKPVATQVPGGPVVIY